jgi:hypothetical protein
VVNSVAVNGTKLRNDYKAPAGAVQIVFWVDGVPIYSTTVVDNKMFRLPSGMKYDNFQYSLSSNTSVSSVCIAETAKGLQTV